MAKPAESTDSLVDIQPFKDRYASILKRYAQDRQERYLAEAAELGRQLVQANIPPEDIAEIHADALLGLAGESPHKTLSESVEQISAPLTEMLMAYGLAFRRQLDQRKRVQEALETSEAFLNETGRMTKVGGWQVDAVTKEVRWTPVTYQIHEVPLDYKPSLDEAINFYDPQDRPKLASAIQRALEHGEPYDMEIRFITAKGKHLWTHTICRPHIADGKTVKLTGTFQDITERKQAEEQIRGLAKFPSEDPYPILRVRRDGVVLYANLAASSLVGTWGPDRWKQLVAEACDSGSKRQIELEHQGRIFLFSVVPIPDADYLNLYGVDITERKKAQQEIEDLAKFPSEDPYPVLRISADGIVLYCNQGGLPLFNAWKCKVHRRLPDHWCAFTAQALNDKQPRQTEVQLADRMYSLTFAPVLSGGYVNVYGLDITDRKHAELELFRRQAQLKSLASQLTLAEERERRRIAADLHDRVSQSLAFARLRLDTLCRTQPLPGQARILKELSNLLGRTIKQTKSLTFDLSSPELYEMGFTAAVSEWLAENVEGQYDIKTEIEDDGQPRPMAEDVRILMFRNVRELLTNTIKHAHARNVRVSLSSQDSQITVRIQDDGIGFDPAQTTKHAARRGEFGLFSIAERLEELGGSLEINSSHGKGCTVTMTAPLQEKQSCREK